ncbi:uncharacterized protein [Rutidosis leptorrhynchoides]|uniref:uncharacterized protein n=1 Tax=Rutidosis leptorrhynchoides TaxID=125765 RepID=UPI003A99D825
MARKGINLDETHKCRACGSRPSERRRSSKSSHSNPSNRFCPINSSELKEFGHDLGLRWNPLNPHCLCSDFFLAIRGKWVISGQESIIADIATRFNELIARNNLIEIPINGRKFTRISDDGEKFSKLDRFLVNGNFISLWKDLSVQPLDRQVSDHCPLILKDKYIDFGPKPFKIFNEWFTKYGVEDIVKNAWVKPVTSKRLDCIFRDRLKNVMFDLHDWSKREFGNLDTEINDLKSKVEVWEKIAECGSLNDNERKTWLDDRKSWIEKENIKINMLKQKAKNRWILEGDENSKFFHASIQKIYNKSNIRGLNKNGSWNENPSEVKDAIRNHFQKIFESKVCERPQPVIPRPNCNTNCNTNSPPTNFGLGNASGSTVFTRLANSPVYVGPDFPDLLRLTISEASDLELSFCEKEIWEAIKNCGGTKAPGPDGFNLSFYKKYWDTIKGDLVNAIQCFWENGEISKG